MPDVFKDTGILWGFLAAVAVLAVAGWGAYWFMLDFVPPLPSR
jgi:hypothetical protein